MFGGRYESRPAEVIVADEFIAEKSYKARGKRVTTYEVKQINEIEPLDSGEEEMRIRLRPILISKSRIRIC